MKEGEDPPVHSQASERGRFHVAGAALAGIGGKSAGLGAMNHDPCTQETQTQACWDHVGSTTETRASSKLKTREGKKSPNKTKKLYGTENTKYDRQFTGGKCPSINRSKVPGGGDSEN